MGTTFPVRDIRPSGGESVNPAPLGRTYLGRRLFSVLENFTGGTLRCDPSSPVSSDIQRIEPGGEVRLDWDYTKRVLAGPTRLARRIGKTGTYFISLPRRLFRPLGVPQGGPPDRGPETLFNEPLMHGKSSTGIEPLPVR